MQTQDLISRFAEEERSNLSRAICKQVPRWLASKMDGSDLIQDTFLELLSSKKIKVEDRRECWALVSVALRNNLKDSIRKFLSLKRDFQRELSVGQDEECLATEQSLKTESSLARQQLIRSLLDRLPLPYSAVLEAYYLEGATHEQIGQRLSRSKDAVRMLLRRAEQAAQSILRSDGYSSPSI